MSVKYRSKGATYKNLITRVSKLVETHDTVAASSIFLIASGNVVSQRVREIMKTDLLHRAAEGKGNSAFFPGLDSFYKIESFSENEIARIFSASFAELRPLSGSQANLIVYSALTNVGDTIIAPSIKSGSHISISGRVIRNLRGYNFETIDTIPNTTCFDNDILKYQILKTSPTLMVLGGSVIIEWQDIEEIVEFAHRNGCRVVYDASHVAGLIATKVFPNPLEFGVDIMTMTTCKTIPGPSHAWILGKAEFKKKIEDMVFPGFVSGGHLQEYIGSILSLFEIMQYGKTYGEMVVRCAKLMGSLLENNGVELLKTRTGEITETHQILIKNIFNYPVEEIEKKLAKIGVFCNVNYLPGSACKGIRLGTQEIVRLGAEEKDIAPIVSVMLDFIKSSGSESFDVYINRVKKIRSSFSGSTFQ